MGRGGKSDGHKRKEDPTAPKAQPDAPEPPVPPKETAAAKEARFMAALEKMIGGEVTEDKLREAIERLTPEQRAELMAEGGNDLKQELVTNPEHAAELNLFRKEVNGRADAADLPVEKDGEHLAKKIVAFMANSSVALPLPLLRVALASTPYLVTLARAAARAEASKAEPPDLAAIEAECVRLKVEGWRGAEAEGRPPFVRRNLLLLHYQMHQSRMLGVHLQPSSSKALAELVLKVRRLLDVLFKYALHNKWVKAALAITDLQCLLVNGLWDSKDDECRELMQSKLHEVGMKLPKLNLRCTAADVQPGEKVCVKMEIARQHAYSASELAAFQASAAAEAKRQGEALGPEDAPDEGEGWWVIVESLRSKGSAKMPPGSEITHNALVGRTPVTGQLTDAVMTGEISFESPHTPGEYKVMMHVRSSGVVGVDVQRKVTFNVLRGKRALPSSSSGGSTEATEPDGEGVERMLLDDADDAPAEEAPSPAE